MKDLRKHTNIVLSARRREMFKKKIDSKPGSILEHKPEIKTLLTTKFYRFIKKGEVYGVQNVKTNSLGEVYYEDSSLAKSYWQQDDESSQVFALLKHIDCGCKK
jgi:hypothetical protein